MMIPNLKTKYRAIIAIDPDVDGSGFAILNGRVLHTRRMMMPELIEFLRGYRKREDVVVVVEAGWLNPSNQHIKGTEKARYASKIGEKIGRCHEIGRQILEFCKFYDLPHVEKFPLKKIWNTRDGKISHKELMALCAGSRVEYGFETKDQEQRDAALLAIDHSGIPMIMAPIKQ